MFDVYAQKIPAEIKDKVKAAAERCRVNKLRADRADVELLFEVYREYLAPHDRQKIDCRACRSKVIGIFTQILKQWEK